MLISIDNENEQFIEPNLDVLNLWWQKSTGEIYSKDRLIYCVEIDGDIFYRDYESFIVNNREGIKRVNIKTLTRMESLIDTESALKDYLNRFIPSALNVSDTFYGEISEECWSLFSQFIEGLNWILKSMDFARLLHQENTINLPPYSTALQKLEKVVGELDQSLNQRDYVMVGDLIQYEIIPILEQFQGRTFPEV